MLGVFLDTETNGLNWQRHSILEISFIIQNLISGEEVASYEAMLIPTDEEWERSDLESLAYTGIRLEDLRAQGKDKTTIQREILKVFEDNQIKRGSAVFICQNPSFDRVFFSKLIDVATQERLKLPYYWLDLASMYWCKRAEEADVSYKFSISKDSIAKHYGIEEEERPHRALAGVQHLIDCYSKVVGFPKKDSLK